jgi:2-methylisocitrate lyase-like PEP mutase family enzyme
MPFQTAQAEKAELFRKQHQNDKMLILPNCWDALSARLIEAVGFPSVATASVATALINGYADGEKIPFQVLLKQIREITTAVNVPVSVDLERGFAEDLEKLKENIKALIDNGAIGLNIEDGLSDGKGLVNLDQQSRIIATIRETGIQCGVPIVINARTDLFLQSKTDSYLIPEAIRRITKFKDAGADCAYPIFINSYETIETLVQETGFPLNILLLKPVSDLARLEKLGVARVSVGPGLIKAALTKIKNSAAGLMRYNAEEFFKEDFISNDFLKTLIIN